MAWQESEMPALGTDEVLIKTIATAISIGAELPQYEQSDAADPFPVYPRKVGYESYGEVVAIGSSVRMFKTGDKVIAFYGQKNFGIMKAENAYPVPEHIDSRTALLAILSCDAAKGVRKLNPKKQARVMVTGMGTMGWLAVHYLKNFFKVQHVDVIEPDRNRWNMAKTFGVNAIYSPADYPEDLYDFGIECSATNEGFACLQQAVKSHGEICVLSDGNKETLALQPEFFEKELRIVGSSDGWDYREHTQWFYGATESTPYVKDIFQHEIDHTEIGQCFEALANGEISPIKVFVSGWES
ncbi:zinc-dependent alcohol dehydrogenase [Planococcus koreensis]|uniref:zinc-dependent alcohol dehydrogenase n=1 Tax=Planococcus koreensis TaxID=112331 RepID=UPI0039FC8478